MTIPTITALPTPPSRNDPTNFATRADAFVAALPTLQAEINAFAAAVLAAAAGTNYNCTSSSSVTIGTGSKSFTASTGSLLQVGQYVIVASTASPANYMLGQVTAYNAGTGALAVNVIATGGSGTIASWTISLAVDPALALPRAGDGLVGSPGIAFSSDTDTGLYRPGADIISLVTGGVERARVDASGNTYFYGAAEVRKTSGTANLNVSRTDVANAYLSMAHDGSNSSLGGGLGNFNISTPGVIYFAGGGGFKAALDSTSVRPYLDNGTNLGTGSFRFSVVYAVTGTINTSDERTKQDIGGIPDEWLDAWSDVDWQRYKFIDAVQDKGDDARWHLGLVAQAVRDAFLSHGLDAQAIGLLCYDQWDDHFEPVYEPVEIPAMLDDDEVEIAPARTEMVDTGEVRLVMAAGDRWGLRYDECFAMEAAYQRRRMDRLEDRLALLEA